MRNWIKYHSGRIQWLADDGSVYVEDFMVARDRKEFQMFADQWAAGIAQGFPLGHLNIIEAKMYVKLNKKRVLRLINGITADDGNLWESLETAPAFYGQFDRDHAGFAIGIKDVFVDKRPRKKRLRKKKKRL